MVVIGDLTVLIHCHWESVSLVLFASGHLASCCQWVSVRKCDCCVSVNLLGATHLPVVRVVSRSHLFCHVVSGCCIRGHQCGQMVGLVLGL